MRRALRALGSPDPCAFLTGPRLPRVQTASDESRTIVRSANILTPTGRVFLAFSKGMARGRDVIEDVPTLE